MRLGCGWRHARKRGAGNFGDFWKKQLVEIYLWARLVEIRTWARPVQLWSTGYAARLLGQWVEIGLWGRLVQLRSWLKNDVETVSIVKIVSLSPHVEKLKVKKKLINVSYLNYRESSVFFGIPMHLNILCIRIMAILHYARWFNPLWLIGVKSRTESVDLRPSVYCIWVYCGWEIIFTGTNMTA